MKNEKLKVGKWEEKPWKNVVDIRNGKNQKAVQRPNGKYPIYGSGGVFGYANDFLCPADTTIIGRKGSINNPIFVEEKFWNVDTAFGLVAKEGLIPKFLHYFCLGFDFTVLNKSTTLPSLTKKNLSEIKIPIPPLPEQRRIVSKLDALFAEIDTSLALIDQNIDQAEALKLSVLDEEFGKIEHKEKLAKVTNFGPKKTEVRDMGDIECSFLPMKDLNEKRIDFEPREIRKIEDVYKRYTYFKDNDVLLAKVTPCFQNRKAGVAKNLTNGIGFGSSEYFVFRPSAKIMSEYLYYFLMTADFINRGVVNMSGAVGLKRVTTDYIKRVEIPLPDLNHQENVVNKIQNVFVEVDGLVKDYKQKRANLEALKSSLLDSAFKGEL